MKALPLLAVLGLGVALGYLLGASSSDAVPARTTTVKKSTPVTPARRVVTSDSGLAERLRQLPVPDVPRGAGTITGKVTNAQGEPVAGVTIRGRPIADSRFRRPKGKGVPEDRTIEESVRRYVANLHRTRLGRVEVVTGSDGTFVLAGITDDRYWVEAFLIDHDLKQSKYVRAGNTIDFVARPIVTVPVEILLPDGTRPGLAYVYCKSDGIQATEPWTADPGSIQISPGTYTFTASVQGMELKSGEVLRTVELGKPIEVVVLKLKGQPSIKGTVKVKGAESVRSLNVYALRFSDRKPDDEALVRNGKRTWMHRQEFTVQEISAGRYRVGVVAGEVVLASRVVDVPEHSVRADFEIKELNPAAFVRVRAVGPDGKPAVAENITTGFKGPRSSSSGGSTWIKMTDGSYYVAHHESDRDDGNGEYWIEFKTARYGGKRLTYERGERNELEFQFGAPGTVHVTIAGFARSEYQADLSVKLSRKKKGDDQSFSSKKPDGDGKVTLGPVEPGEYELLLLVRAGRHSHATAARRQITVRKGKSTESLAIPRLYRFTVTGAEAGSHMALSGDGTQIWDNVGKKGEMTFGPLPAGRYQLSGQMARTMTVTLPGPARVAWNPEEVNALRVKIRDTDGLMAQAGFLDGDIVVGIDGKEFKDMQQMQMLFAGAMAKEEVTFNIVRGNSRVEIVIRMKTMMKGDGGGNMEPIRR